MDPQSHYKYVYISNYDLGNRTCYYYTDHNITDQTNTSQVEIHPKDDHNSGQLWDLQKDTKYKIYKQPGTNLIARFNTETERDYVLHYGYHDEVHTHEFGHSE